MFYLLLVAGLSFPRYLFSELLELFAHLDFAFSSPVCPRVCSLEKIFPSGQRPGTGGLGSLVWPVFGYAPMTMDMNIVCSSIHLVPVLQTNTGSRQNPPSPCQNFSSSPERSRITAIVVFFSSFFFFYTPLVVRFRRHASYD